MFDRNLSYFVYSEKIFSDDECDLIIKELKKEENAFEDSKIGKNDYDPYVRKSKSFPIPEESEFTDLLINKFSQGFLNYCENYLEDLYFTSLKESTINGYFFEPFLFVNYKETDFYNWHTDQGDNSKTAHRLLSFILYLNDDFVGGYTEFAFKKHKPKKGELLIFPSNFLFPHTGTRIIKGEKNIITSWLNNVNYGRKNDL